MIIPAQVLSPSLPGSVPQTWGPPVLFNSRGGYGYGPFYRRGVPGHHPPLQAATPAALELRGPQPTQGVPGEDGGGFPASRGDGGVGKALSGSFHP